MSTTFHPVPPSASSMASSIHWGAGSRTGANAVGPQPSTAKPGSRSCMPSTRPSTVLAIGPTVSSVGERSHAVERHAPVRRLQPRDPAARGRDANRAAGVGPERDLGVVVRHRDRRAARRAAGDQVGVERVHGRAEPRVHAVGAEGELHEVGLPDDPGVGGARAGEAEGVGRGRRRPSARYLLPEVVGTPAMSMRSLTVSRGPTAPPGSVGVMKVAMGAR